MTANLNITPYTVATRFLGTRELPGLQHNPAIVAMLELVDRQIRDDETPWCSGFVNYVCWLLGVPRSGSLAARSWLGQGTPVALTDAAAGFDVVILSRGSNAPPADVREAPGHVGFFSSYDSKLNVVCVLGGNQSNQVCLERFPITRVLGVRRVV